MNPTVIEHEGITYTLNRKTNLSETKRRRFVNGIAPIYKALAAEWLIPEEELADDLVTYADLSAQCRASAESRLLSSADSAGQVEAKCKAWMLDSDCYYLAEVLTPALMALNTPPVVEPLTPEPPKTKRPRKKNAEVTP